MMNSRTTATMMEIAAALGVSAATVSNALSGKGRVSAELVEKIRKAAAERGYVPSHAARALRTGRSGVFGLVLPDIANPLFPQIAQAVEQAAADAGYGLLIADSRDDARRQEKAIGRLTERGVDGLVIVLRRGSRVGDAGVPVAVIDSLSNPHNTVSSDHRAGGIELGRHLWSLGHRKVVLVGQSSSSDVQKDRIAGLVEGLGPDARCETIWLDSLEKIHGAGFRLDLVSRVEAGVTACAATSDLLALRLLTKLQRCGIAVPQTVSVSGFDDLVWASVVTPQLTTLKPNLAVIAEKAVKALEAAIRSNGDSPVAKPDGGEGVPMQLVVRQSTAPARTIGAKNHGGSP